MSMPIVMNKKIQGFNIDESGLNGQLYKSI